MRRKEGLNDLSQSVELQVGEGLGNAVIVLHLISASVELEGAHLLLKPVLIAGIWGSTPKICSCCQSLT